MANRFELITIQVCDSHCEIILKSLELYAYNLHYLIKENTDDYYLKNMELLHTYNEILSKLSSYRSHYDVCNNCQHEINYYLRKKYKKISA